MAPTQSNIGKKDGGIKTVCVWSVSCCRCRNPIVIEVRLAAQLCPAHSVIGRVAAATCVTTAATSRVIGIARPPPVSITSPPSWWLNTKRWALSLVWQSFMLVAFCSLSTVCPLPCNRQHLSYGDCLEGKRGDYLTRSVLLCIIIVHIICTPI